MRDRGINRGDTNNCCYLKKDSDSYLILLLYVDDMLIACSSLDKINILKQELSQEFEMKDLGPANQILGMRIIRNLTTSLLSLSQERYITKVLERFQVEDAKSRSTSLVRHFKLSKEQSPKTMEEREQMSKVPYASTVDSLMYVMVCT